MGIFIHNLQKSIRQGATEKSDFIDKEGNVTKLTPFSHVDTPTMSYQKWLKSSANKLANLKHSNMKLAIIGAGVGGITVGFELLRAGFTDFSIYEASNRIGGRFDSHTFPDDTTNFAELGAMRFPPTEGCLYYYIQFLQEQYKIGKQPHKITMKSGFPDPGTVPTMVSFKDQFYIVDPSDLVLPPDVEKISKSWSDFTSRKAPISLGDGELLPAPASIMDWLDNSGPDYNPVKAANAWQVYVNKFKNKSLVEAMIDIFCQPNAPGGNPWHYPKDIDVFGAVGTGIGGNAPLFEISFVDMMRFTLNKLEENHAQIVTGANSVTNGLVDCQIEIDGRIHMVRDHIKLDSPVGEMKPSADRTTISLYNQNTMEILEGHYTHIVAATTHRAAEIDLKVDSRWSNPVGMSSIAKSKVSEQIIDMDSREAISKLHIGQSSKFFIKVRPWWKEDDTKVRCITMDTAMANFYTLDYGENAEESVCLMNYTWEDWSEKSETLGDINERYQRFLQDLKLIAPDYILDAMPVTATADNAVMIDWQKEKHYYGAFMLTYPFQEKMLSTMFYNFKEERFKEFAKVFFVGDSYHWIGGWCEGAFQTSLNAFCAITKSVNRTLTDDTESPMKKLSPLLINYGNPGSNASVLPFGPVGGIGGVTAIYEWIKNKEVTLYYTNMQEPIINGLRIGKKMYGTLGTEGMSIMEQDINTVKTLRVYVCQSDTVSFLKTGRIRCIEINETVYGPKPRAEDFSYDVHVEGEGRKIVAITGVSGHDIDRIGFILSS